MSASQAKQTPRADFFLYKSWQHHSAENKRSLGISGFTETTVSRAQSWRERQKPSPAMQTEVMRDSQTLIFDNKASSLKWEAIAATISGSPHFLKCKLHRSILWGIQRTGCLISILYMLYTGQLNGQFLQWTTVSVHQVYISSEFMDTATVITDFLVYERFDKMRFHSQVKEVWLCLKDVEEV